MKSIFSALIFVTLLPIAAHSQTGNPPNELTAVYVVSWTDIADSLALETLPTGIWVHGYSVWADSTAAFCDSLALGFSGIDNSPVASQIFKAPTESLSARMGVAGTVTYNGSGLISNGNAALMLRVPHPTAVKSGRVKITLNMRMIF